MKAGYEGRPPILIPVEGLHERERKAKVQPMRNANHCRICWLRYHKHISPALHAAGETLQNAQALADRAYYGPGSKEFGMPSGKMYRFGGCAVAALEASDLLRAGWSYVGEEAEEILRAVVLDDLGTEQAAQRMRIHEKGVIPSLRVALGCLSRYWALTRVG